MPEDNQPKELERRHLDGFVEEDPWTSVRIENNVPLRLENSKTSTTREIYRSGVVFSRMFAYSVITPHFMSSRKRLLGKFHISHSNCPDALAASWVSLLGESLAYGALVANGKAEYAIPFVLGNVASKLYENHRRKQRNLR